MWGVLGPVYSQLMDHNRANNQLYFLFVIVFFYESLEKMWQWYNLCNPEKCFSNVGAAVYSYWAHCYFGSFTSSSELRGVQCPTAGMGTALLSINRKSLKCHISLAYSRYSLKHLKSSRLMVIKRLRTHLSGLYHPSIYGKALIKWDAIDNKSELAAIIRRSTAALEWIWFHKWWNKCAGMFKRWDQLGWTVNAFKADLFWSNLPTTSAFQENH